MNDCTPPLPLQLPPVSHVEELNSTYIKSEERITEVHRLSYLRIFNKYYYVKLSCYFTVNIGYLCMPFHM